jgi:nicotinate-nucleotide pyrophosphorylase (carboxylating)
VILSCERVILNLLQRLSGVATLTRRYVDAVAGTGVKILDTRKTVPGWRTLDKYAVRCGGGENHRNDLSDGILIKNNHISLGGGVKAVLTKAFAAHKSSQPIEIEVRNMAELEEALGAGAQAILLDNMSPAQVRAAVQKIRAFEETLKTPRHIPIEASGGMNLENIRQYAETAVDFISVGALTHSAKAIDMSMRITPAIT